MVNIIKWDPFKEIENMSRSVFGDAWANNPSLFAPTTDVYVEDDSHMIVEAHLPGYNDKDVDINVHEGILEVRAEKHEQEEDKKKRRYVMRESSSSFYRRIRLPKNADANKIEAHMDEGLLKIVVPFKELPKPTKIAIKAKTTERKQKTGKK